MVSDEVNLKELQTEKLVVVEEFDRQQHYANILKSSDFFDNNDLIQNLSDEQKRRLERKLRKEKTMLPEIDQPCSDDEADYDGEHDVEDTATLNLMKPIDVINHKILKLDTIFSSLADVHEQTELSPIEPSFKIREELQRRKDKENKQLNLFAGVYSLKSVFYPENIRVPPPVSLKVDQEAAFSGPKLAETYQFSGYLPEDTSQLLALPHLASLDQVQQQVFNSMTTLRRQPGYRRFLQEVYFSKLVQRLIVNTFYWCFLERYQRIEAVQRELFKRVSENYVDLTYKSLNPRYKETFFKKLADYVAMTIYTIFCTSFPDSFQTQFNREFKEFLCEICWLWISGCKPIPRSFSHWNFLKLDPESAVRAAEILNSNTEPRIITSNATNTTRNSIRSKTTSSKYISSTSSLSKPNSAFHQTTFEVRSCLPVNSHPLCASHEMQSSLFNLNGHSPLVECYLHNKKARQINKPDILVQHACVMELPPLNATTYNDVIRSSVTAIKKIERNLKTVQKRQENNLLKMEATRIKFMKEYKRNQELLLSKPQQVGILSDLIAMSKKKDPYESGFQKSLENALAKALKKSGSTYSKIEDD